MITQLFVKAQLFTAAFKRPAGVTAIEYAILGVYVCDCACCIWYA